jgi:hypothetical protein
MTTISNDFVKNIHYTTGELGTLEEEEWFSYEGYDPELMFKVLRQLETNDDILIRDLKNLCYFSVNRGTRVSKSTLKMSEKGRDEIRRLSRKYKIIDTIPKNKEDVTIARIVGVMPVYVASLLEAHKGRIIGIQPEGLPRGLCFPGAASIIPKSRADIYSLWLKWSMTFNQIIANGKNSERVDFYGQILWNSSYIDNELRLATILSMN